MLEDVDKVLETMQVEEESPIDDKIQPTEEVPKSKSVTDFKCFGTLHNTVHDINDQLLCSDVQTECMMSCDNQLRRSNETLTNWHQMSSMKSACIRDKWLYMTCSNNNVWTLILVKNMCTWPICVLKQENTIVSESSLIRKLANSLS